MHTGVMFLRLSLGFFFSFITLFFVVPSVFAQSVLSCTPLRATVNRDLQVGISANPGDLYVSGSAYLGLDSAQAPILTNTGATNLLFKTANGDYLFEDKSGNRYAGLYRDVTGASAAANGTDGFVHGLVVDGKIEGYQVNGANQLCINGSCLSSWPTACTGSQKLTASGSTFVCANDVDTRCDISGAGECANVYATTSVQSSGSVTATGNVSGAQLCIGATCYSSWGSAVQGGLTALSAGSVGRGVTRIIAGSGVTVTSVPTTGNPAYGEGDVTVSASGTSYGQPFAVHSLSSSVPSLPATDFDLLWTGYSLVATYTQEREDYRKNLNSPESCVPSFTPIPLIECGNGSVTRCDFSTPFDVAMWLTSGMTTDSLNESVIADILPKIGRCAVFLPKRSVVIKYDNSVMGSGQVSGPAGWTRTYDGYTLQGATLGQGFTGTSSAACIQNFAPQAMIECGTGGCDFYTGGDYTVWATGATTATGALTSVAAILPYIGRCALFIKD